MALAGKTHPEELDIMLLRKDPRHEAISSNANFKVNLVAQRIGNSGANGVTWGYENLHVSVIYTTASGNPNSETLPIQDLVSTKVNYNRVLSESISSY